MKNWEIWIDTGGTFTDCIATDPKGEVHRVKVLSSSKLRGTLNYAEGKSATIKTNWKIERDIFRDYEFRIPSSDFQSEVVAFDPGKQQLELSENLPSEIEDLEFEITASEEAPILAVRLVTQTALDEDLPKIEMRLGTTKGTNALLEHKGDAPLLVTTKGFRDLLTIGNQQRPDLFQLNINKPQQLPTAVFELDERIATDGKVVEGLKDEELEKLLNFCRENGTENVAIGFINSYQNQAHERQVFDVLQKAGVEFITESAGLNNEIKFLERTETAVVNAYLLPIIDNYLEGIEKYMHLLNIMTSAGGLSGRKSFNPKDSLLSGPAGGVVAGSAISQQTGEGKIITFDMGGTSTDVARYYKRFDYTYETTIGHAHITGPALHIHTVAAGGGSICDFDGKKFTVGPESGGANPGPASYGAGGPLCITDINLLLGKMATDNMSIPLNKKAAQKQLDSLLEKGSISTDQEEILQGFLDIANEKMADAIREISVSKGYDPAEYALLAFGGAGGMHACKVAELLSMKKLIIPQDAGILSAFGIGNALEERFVSRQLLVKLEEKETIEDSIKEASKEAWEALKTSGYDDDEIELRHVFCYLRFVGQEHELEIDQKVDPDLEEAFKKNYKSLYGHYIEGRPIEIASIKVVASTKQKELNTVEIPNETTPAHKLRVQKTWSGSEWKEVPVFAIGDMKSGNKIEGPAIIIYPTSTAFLEENWTGVFDENLTFIANLDQSAKRKSSNQPEEVQLELFSNRFTRIAEEMGALLQRTAFSVNVKERLDFSCALLDPGGDLVVNAPHIPVHLGALGVCVKQVKEAIEMNEGDVVITNHPAFGGSHLPDVTLIMPIHFNGELVGYAANRSHHAEIGGISPGSMPARATNLSEEGVVIAPTHLMKNGIVQWDHIEKILKSGKYPTRALQENLADLNAALASLKSGKSQLKNLIETEGQEKVAHYMQMLKSYASESLWKALEKFSGKELKAVEKLDDGSILQVKVTVGEELEFDFEGTSETHPVNLNANRAITTSVILYVLRLISGENIPLNEGMLEKVKIKLPEDCMLNPKFSDDPAECPAVVGGNVEVSQRLTDTILKAFELAACSQGTMNNVLFGNDQFGFYETICGGTGAGPDFDGADAVHQHMTNTKITDPEIMEHRYPVRVVDFSIRENSGGKGKHQGGNGVKRELEFLEDVTLTVLTQHRETEPYGLKGGENGKVGLQFVRRKDGNEVKLKPTETVEINKGDHFVIETPGGGGFGKV